MTKFNNLKIGDRVTRMVAGEVMMELKVTDITNDKIICGPWEFSKKNGAEIDPELNWGEHLTGSYLSWK